jgi:hypothetical protein
MAVVRIAAAWLWKSLLTAPAALRHIYRDCIEEAHTVPHSRMGEGDLRVSPHHARKCPGAQRPTADQTLHYCRASSC